MNTHKIVREVLDRVRRESYPAPLFPPVDPAMVERTMRAARKARRRATWVTVVANCGGPGSGVPGPCPSGRRSDEDIAKSFGTTDTGGVKPAGWKPTGQTRGQVGYVSLSKIDLMGQRLDEVTPLESNDDKPVILKKHGDKYRIVDGFGRTNGMLNAGNKRIRAVVVSDRDLSFRTVTGDDENWNRKIYRKYFPGLHYHPTTNSPEATLNASNVGRGQFSSQKSPWRVTIKRLAPYLLDLMPDLTKGQAAGIARSIQAGLRSGLSDDDVATMIEGYGIDPARAKMIARTEMSRARADTELGRLKPNERVVYRLSATACPKCVKVKARLKERRLTAKQAEGIIPVHPNCYCSWKVVNRKSGREIVRNVGTESAPVDAAILEYSRNVFCATGEGGGVDPTCGKGDSTPPSFSGEYQSVEPLKDKKGNPVNVFHGSNKEFEEFKDGVIYFSPNPGYSYVWNGPHVYEAEIALKNPYRTEHLTDVEGAAYQPNWVAELKAKGYDGIIYSKSDNILKGPLGWGNDRPQYVVFSKDQIRLKKRYTNEDFQIAVQLGDVTVNVRMEQSPNG